MINIGYTHWFEKSNYYSDTDPEMNESWINLLKYDPEKFMENSYGGTFCYLIHKRGAAKLLHNLIQSIPINSNFRKTESNFFSINSILVI